MRRKKQNPNQIKLGYWWHFFLTFLFGVFLVFAFSVLVSLSNTTLDKAELLTRRFIFPWGPAFNFYVYPIYLSLTIAGALGGLLYSILLDGSLELPSWGKNGNSLNPGSLGEVFVGIGGAFTAYAFWPPELFVKNDNKEIIIFVIGLVGGYGGKAILDAALSKIIKRIDEADLVKEEKERLTEQLSDQDALLTLVTKQLDQGLVPSDINQLSELIKNAPEDLKERVFTRTKVIRSLSGQTKTARDKITLTIPIFQALVDSDPKNYEYKIQLAYALKDSEPPRLNESISLLDEVIKLRGDRIVGDTWKVELNRALARIMQEQQTGNNTNSSPWKEQILADLFIVDRNYGLPKVLLESEDEIVDIPLKDWLVKNQEWIKQNSGGADLLQKSLQVALSPTPQSSGVVESRIPVATAGSRPSIDELKASTSGSVSTRSLRNGRSSTSIIETDHLKVAPPNTKIKAKTKTYLKKHPIDSSQLPSNQKTEVPAGKEYKVLKYSEEIDRHCLVELDYRLGIWYLWSDHWDLPWEEHSQVLSSVQGSAITKMTATQSSSHQSHDIVTRQQAQSVYGRALTDQQFKDLNDCLNRFEINTVQRVRHFLSQTALESGGLRYMTELWGPTKDQRTYDPPNRKAKELGNTNPGDGKKYRGGGVIQLTGRDNYQKFSKFINDPKVMNGADYVGATYPFSSAGFFWKNKNINALCDRGGTVEQVTFKVNGGYNGLPERKRYYDKACQVIKQISAPTFVATVQPTVQSFGNVNLGNDLASRIIKYMNKKGYQVFTNPREYNIVYVEGMNPNGTLNDDRPNMFNDLRMVIEFTNGQPKIVGSWEATTEPGDKYTYSPQNPNGAARIKFGQYQAWIKAWHPMPKGSNSHEALFQTQPIEVYRDSNKDFQRSGDMVQKGVFGINQHWGYDLPKDAIGGASAGCLVGRTKQGHKEFMAIVKQDKRYISNPNYVFYTTVIPGDDLNKEFPPA